MADIKKYVSLDKLTKYDGKIKGYIETKDAEVKAYADSLADNYDAAGSAATVQGKLDEEVARAKAAEEANAAAAKKAQDEVDALELVVQNIQENAYDDTEVRGLISGLDTNKADKTQVATDIADAVKTEKEAREAAVAGVQGAVDTLSGTHATDKKALEDAIALKADQTALDEVAGVANAAVAKTTYEAKVAELVAEDERIAGLVATESERAVKAEGDLETRIETMEVFWDATEDSDGVVNKLKEIQDYIASDETGAATMAGNIQTNTQAIAAMDEAYKAADATLQGNIDTLSGTVATKAAQTDLETLEDRVEAVEGVADKNSEDIAALQAKFAGEGEGTVADQIADAVASEKAERESAIAEVQADADKGIEDAAAALEAAQAADTKAQTAQNEVDALELVVNSKAAQADLETLTGRVTTAEGKITTLEGEMDAVEALAAANKAAHEANAAAIAKKAEQEALQAEIDRATARENAIEAKVDAFVEVSEEEINALFPTA